MRNKIWTRENGRSYKNQKEVSNKVNKYINNLHSTRTYNVSRVREAPAPALGTSNLLSVQSEQYSLHLRKSQDRKMKIKMKMHSKFSVVLGETKYRC